MSDMPVSEKLSELIRCKTVSYNEDSLFDTAEFKDFARKLETLFPLCHREMKKETFSDFALLYTWEGTDRALEPALYIAHYDVVPVSDENDWQHSPFSGDIAEGFIWGRGAVDIKNQLCAMMESCEQMIRQGVKPERSLYLAWGGDEEVSGFRGAGVISDVLKSRNLRFSYLMDEGGVLSSDQLTMLDKPVALIGVEEKGMLNLTLSCSGKPGHSSMPPSHTSIGVLSAAVKKIEDNPFPSRLTTGTRGLFTALAPHCRGIHRLIFSHLGLFGWLLKRFLVSSDNTNAMIRTSQSVTIIKGGCRENVLPAGAECNINFRILPGETMDTVIRRITKLVNNPDITIEPARDIVPNEPVLIKNMKSPWFDALCGTVKQIWPEAVPAPYLVMGGTDSKFYKDLTDNIFRFSPVLLDRKELEGMHGLNERISIENLENMVDFYKTMITKTCCRL